jgi:hypothetical protein
MRLSQMDRSVILAVDIYSEKVLNIAFDCNIKLSCLNIADGLGPQVPVPGALEPPAVIAPVKTRATSPLLPGWSYQ